MQFVSTRARALLAAVALATLGSPVSAEDAGAAAEAQESVSLTCYLAYETVERAGPAEVVPQGRAGMVYYRIWFRPDDAREIHDYWYARAGDERDESEIVNKLMREALTQEDYPSRLMLRAFRIELGDEPAREIEYPGAGDEGEIVYTKVRVVLEGGGRSVDWMRAGSSGEARLLGKGRIVAEIP